MIEIFIFKTMLKHAFFSKKNACFFIQSPLRNQIEKLVKKITCNLLSSFLTFQVVLFDLLLFIDSESWDFRLKTKEF